MKTRPQLSRVLLAFALSSSAAAGLALGVPPPAQAQSITSWGGPGSGNGEFTLVGGVTVGPTGSVYASDLDPGGTSFARIQQFTSSGAFVRAWGTVGAGDGQMNRPFALSTDASGNVFVADSGNSQVDVFTSTGSFSRSFGSFASLPFVQGLEVAADGSGYTAGGYEVKRFDAAGVVGTSWGGFGSADGQFEPPEEVDIDSTGDVFVADGYNQRIQRFDADGTFELKWSVPDYARGVAIDSGNNVFVPVNDNGIIKYDRSGNRIGSVSLPEGAVRVGVAPSGLVYAGSNNRIYRIDPAEPTASLEQLPGLVETDSTVNFDASGSFVPFSAPSNYSWDLDGDGSFETDSGRTPRASKIYAGAGRLRVSVKVTAPSGQTHVASIPVDVRRAPSAGPKGVSINSGEQYTNDPNVRVSARWPRFATTLTVSNDGGFTPFSQLAVAPEFAWELDSSGPERLPKTIYVRFAGGQSGAETYQDDIILDETAPLLRDVAIKGDDASSSRPSLARKGSKLKLRIKAKDKTSGVAEMQVTSKKSKPGDWKKYNKSASLKTKKSKAFVRVRDGAGNVSKWKRAK